MWKTTKSSFSLNPQRMNLNNFHLKYIHLFTYFLLTTVYCISIIFQKDFTFGKEVHLFKLKEKIYIYFLPLKSLLTISSLILLSCTKSRLWLRFVFGCMSSIQCKKPLNNYLTKYYTPKITILFQMHIH